MAQSAKTIAALVFVSAASLSLSGCGGGATSETAQGEGTYAIDVLALDGSETLAFDTDDRLAPTEQSTIEFWVQPGWETPPEFDPVVLSNAGPEGISYLAGLTAEGDGLIIAAGDTLEAVPFDFSDGRMHHVALVDYGDSLSVQINHEAVADLPLTFEAFPSNGLFIGSAAGGEDGFEGRIGGLRIWNVAVEQSVLARYSRRALIGENPHPDLSELKLLSDFTDRTIVFAE